MSSQPPPATAATTQDQIAEASTLFLYSAGVLFSMFAFSFWMTASIQVFCFIGIPLYCLYLAQTCPSQSSFDTRSQMKRVLTGADLPDDDPNKPKGILRKGFRNVTATLASTAATAGGYTETFINILVARIVKVDLPAANLELYWIGCSATWFYWGAVEKDADKRD